MLDVQGYVIQYEWFMIHIYPQIKADKNELTEINICNKTWNFEQFWHNIIVYVTVDKKALTIFELQAWGNRMWSNCVQVISIIRLHPSVYQKWNSKEWRFGIWQKICFQWSLLSNTLYWLFPDMRRIPMQLDWYSFQWFVEISMTTLNSKTTGYTPVIVLVVKKN